jgi:acyl-CoA reductase-like NAD-dependent aldehyde dehydrogenase
MGPLVISEAPSTTLAAIETPADQGGEVLTGGKALDRPGHFVEPAIVVFPRTRRSPRRRRSLRSCG